MYMEYYGLEADPFRLAADYSNLYSQQSFAKALSYAQYGLQSDDGIVLITGQAGTGKTSLINSVLIHEQDQSREAIVIDCLDFNGKQLLAYYSKLLGNESKRSSLTDSIYSINESLHKSRERGRQAVLVLDEAHQLRDDALTKLTTLANQQHAGQPLLQIFLLGQPELWEKITHPRQEQLHQRLVAACQIDPLTDAETKEYILQNLQAAGWDNSPEIAANVYTAVHRSSLGIRRWISLICGRLMLHAMAHNRKRVEFPDLCEVISDLIGEGLLPQEIRETNLIAA